MKQWMFRGIFILGLVAAAAAFSGFKYQDKGLGFAIDLPSDWELGDSGADDMVVALSKWEGPEDAFRENMNIIVTPLEEDIDLETLYNLNLANAQNMLTDFVAWQVDKTALDGVPAVKLIYSFSYEGTTLKNIVYLFVKDKTMYTLTFATSNENFDDHQSKFEEMAESITLPDETASKAREVPHEDQVKDAHQPVTK